MRTSPLVSSRGVPQPRVNLIPPYAYSYGAEALELAKRAGLIADGWQGESVTHMLGVAEDGRWACGDYAEFVARQNGKGALLEIRALAGLFLLGELEIMWTAHRYDTTMKAFKRLKRLVKKLGEQVGDNENLVDMGGDVLVKINNTNGEEGFKRLDTEAELQFVTRSKGGGRGFTGDLLIVDEAMFYTDEHQEALLSTLSARSMEIPGPQIVYTSSPPLKSEPDKVVFRLKKRAEAGDIERLGWRDWGAAGDLDNLDRVDLDDRATWYATNPALGVRISESFVEREFQKLGERGFARERLGIWPAPPADEGDVIDFAGWKALADPASQAGDDLAFAFDITPARDRAAIGVFGPRGDELGHVEVLDERAGTDWIVARLVELKERWNPVAIALDVKGPAGSLLLELADVGIKLPGKGEEPRRGDLIVPTANEVAAGCGSFTDAIEQGKLRHIDQIPLNSAVGGVSTRPLGDAYAWARKTSTANIHPLVAVTLARWAFYARIHAIQDDMPAPATVSAAPPDSTDLWRPTERLRL
ncbi:hypothetical protein [Amycolatopsis thermoflava]|uniref:hypothetical protein n=1 Tax=Amycolatopsis thermoflava TaxID=84480 RepID=UPI0037FF310C